MTTEQQGKAIHIDYQKLLGRSDRLMVYRFVVSTVRHIWWHVVRCRWVRLRLAQVIFTWRCRWRHLLRRVWRLPKASTEERRSGDGRRARVGAKTALVSWLKLVRPATSCLTTFAHTPLGCPLRNNSRSGMMLNSAGRGAAWLARLHGVQEAHGSNPCAPTMPGNPC